MKGDKMRTLNPTSGSNLDNLKRIGTGLAFIFFPMLFIMGFAFHPGLLSPRLLSASELVLRARHADLMQWGHVLDTIGAVLLVVIALRFMELFDRVGGSAAWAGFIGAVLAIWGVMMLAALKGALCLTMSAIDTVSDKEFAQMMPGLLAMFSRKGWMVLLWGIVCLPIGFAMQAIPLIKTRAIPRWQGLFFLIGVLLVGTPDGLEIVNLTAACLMALGLVPYGIQTIREYGA
jgi:energy-coupling factor transporter transmembrane protein EcfT